MMRIPRSNKQTGIVLLEGLIAILIFSVGVLAVVALQAAAFKQVTDAKFRSDAAMLASQLLGTMWAGDRSTAALQAQYQSTSANPTGFTLWTADVSSSLPGTDTYPPAVTVAANGSASLVTITLRWLAPGEASTNTPHKFVSVATIR